MITVVPVRCFFLMSPVRRSIVKRELGHQPAVSHIDVLALAQVNRDIGVGGLPHLVKIKRLTTGGELVRSLPVGSIHIRYGRGFAFSSIMQSPSFEKMKN